MPRGKANPDFLNGVPELAVLRVLRDGPLHGYAIVQSITKRSGGTLKFGEGSIYPILHRLEHDGLLKSRRVARNGRERVVYSLSNRGLKQLEASAARWQAIADSIRALFDGGEDGISPVATATS